MSMFNEEENRGTGTGSAKQPPKTVTSLGAIFSSRVQRSAAGETISAYTQQFNEILRSDNVNGADDDFKVMAIDAQTSGLICGVIVTTLRVGDRAAIFTHIVESTITGQLSDRTYKAHGAPDYSIPVVPGDIYNYGTQVFDKVKEVLSQSTRGVNEWIEAGSDVIPVELQADDHKRLRNVFHRAICALETLFDHSRVINLAELAPTTNFRSRLTFDGVQGETAAGLPTRRAFGIETTASDKSSGAQAAMVLQQSTQLAQVSGYVDLLFTDSVPINTPQGQMLSTQKWQPKLVITDSTPSCNLITPELQLLSLSSIASLLRNGAAWLTTLRPRFKEDELNMHSLNGLQVELGPIFQADDADFDLYAFANTYFHPLCVQIDIPECSDSTWILSLLRDAARGNADAIAAFVHAADNLTNQAFSRRFNSQRIAGVVDDRVILGYYYDKKGEKRDLRELDYLAVLNLVGGNDSQLAFDFGDTFNPNKGPLEQRLSRRVEIIKEIFQGNVKIKGYATPLLLNPEVLIALSEAIEDCGVVIGNDGFVESYRPQARGNTMGMDYSFRPDAFGTGQQGYSGSSSFRPNYQGRRW